MRRFADPMLTLCEREEESRAVATAIGDLAAGAGGVVAVEGPPGIGKSSLLSAAREWGAEAGLHVLAARGAELERGFPYGVARQLLAPPLRAVDAAARGALLAGPAAGARPLLDGEAATEPRSDFEVLDGLHWLTAGLAERGGLLISVDDAQWADAASLRFLAYLARRLDGIAALAIVALRPITPDHEQGALLAGILDEAAGSVGVLRPAPLSETATGAVAGELLGEPADAEFAAACRLATGGNPLLLRELCRGLRDRGVVPHASQVGEVERIGPAAVTDSVRLRLAQLPPEARELAKAASILGDGARLDEAAELAGLAPESARDAADALAGMEIVRGRERLEFVHPLIRDAIEATIGSGEVAAAHAAAAALLADRGAGVERIAGQLLRAPPIGAPERVETLRAAAAAALGTGNPATAVEYLRRALEEPPGEAERTPLLIALAGAEGLVDVSAAVAHMEEALSGAREPRARGEIAVGLATMLPSVDPDRGLEIGLAAARELGDADPELRCRIDAIVLTNALVGGRGGPELDRLERPGPMPERGGAAWRMLECVRGYRRARDGRDSAAVATRVRAALEGDWARHSDVAGGQYLLGTVALIAADHPDTVALAGEWEAAGRRAGRLGAFSGGKMTRAHALLARGRLPEAAAAAEDAVETMRSYGMGGSALAYAASALVEARMRAGDLDGARRAGEMAVAIPLPPRGPNLHGLWLSRARLRAATGEPEAALGEVEGLGRSFEDLGGRNPALLPWRSEAALLAYRIDAVERARELAAEEVELARAWGAPRALGRALTAAARVSGEAGEETLAAEAVAVLERSEAALELVEARLTLGAILRRSRRRVEARAPLAAALELAVECGAAPLERRAREELLAAGARPRRVEVSGPAALTARERQVCELAAAGSSNPEIAAELFLARRTVEAHLHRAFRKLGIGSRTQLPAALGEDRLRADDP